METTQNISAEHTLWKNCPFKGRTIQSFHETRWEAENAKENALEKDNSKTYDIVSKLPPAPTRYFYYSWSDFDGWRQLGYTHGYNSIEELKKDQERAIARGEPYKILEAKEINQ